jgi:poly-gamma-glutamate synthesis protein (capsule biosynthesis protein)
MHNPKIGESRMITISFGGDFCPWNLTSPEWIQSNKKAIWGDVVECFDGSDYNVINLEAPLTNYSIPIFKTGPNIKIIPESVTLLQNAKINLVTLANNHILDYGLDGLLETTRVLNKGKIEFVGAGQTYSDAIKIKYCNIKGKKIGFINVAENEWTTACEERGGANPLDFIENTYQIKTAKEVSDIVIVIIHGGHELFSYPSPRMIRLYRYFADIGASAVIGHHTHFPGGYEVYNNVPIFYSLGNLYFPPIDSLQKTKNWLEGYIVQLQISENNDIKFELFPYKNEDYCIRKLQGIEKKIFLTNLLSINKVIDNHNLLKEAWNEYLESRTDTVTRLSIPWAPVRKVARKLRFEKKIINKKHLSYMLNILRCESHRDVVLGLLKRKFMNNL